MQSLPKNYLAILDVGHGNCTVISDKSEAAVIDTGLGTSLLEFLTERSIFEIDLVILSHADQDHISGLIQLFASKQFVVNKVRLNTDSAKGTKLWRNLVYELQSQELRGLLEFEVQLTANSKEQLSVGDVQLEIIAPGKGLAALGAGNIDRDGKRITSNSISAVVMVRKSGETIAVIPGDIDQVGLRDLKERLPGKQFSTRILVFPHHGGSSGTAPSSDFVREVCSIFLSRIVVFSIGRGMHETPQPDIVRTLRTLVADLRISCTQLSEHCAVKVPDLESQHLLPVFSDGRGERKCCAGTMIVDLDDPNELYPKGIEHVEFISQNAENALCRRSGP